MEYFKLKDTGYIKSKSADKFNLVKKPRIKAQRNKLNIVNTNKDLQYDNTDIFKMLRTFLESMIFNVRNAEMVKAITPIHIVSTTSPEIQKLQTDIDDLIKPKIGRPPGSTSKTLTQKERDDLSKATVKPMLREMNNDTDDEIDSLANTNVRPFTEQDRLKQLIGEPIQGKGLFDTISKVFKTVLPSIKHIIKKPEVQKNIMDIGTTFIKNKMKPKEKPKAPTHDEIEAQEFLRMLKAKEITPAEYRELKSGIINKPVSEIVKPEVLPIVDKNLKDLKDKYHPNKIYSDLLLKKHITPEKYLELTTGKIPNLSQPIVHQTDNVAEVPVMQMAATGLRKKRTSPRHIAETLVEVLADGSKMKARGIGR